MLVRTILPFKIYVFIILYYKTIVLSITMPYSVPKSSEKANRLPFLQKPLDNFRQSIKIPEKGNKRYAAERGR